MFIAARPRSGRLAPLRAAEMFAAAHWYDPAPPRHVATERPNQALTVEPWNHVQLQCCCRSPLRLNRNRLPPTDRQPSTRPVHFGALCKTIDDFRSALASPQSHRPSNCPLASSGGLEGVVSNNDRVARLRRRYRLAGGNARHSPSKFGHVVAPLFAPRQGSWAYRSASRCAGVDRASSRARDGTLGPHAFLLTRKRRIGADTENTYLEWGPEIGSRCLDWTDLDAKQLLEDILRQLRRQGRCSNNSTITPAEQTAQGLRPTSNLGIGDTKIQQPLVPGTPHLRRRTSSTDCRRKRPDEGSQPDGSTAWRPSSSVRQPEPAASLTLRESTWKTSARRTLPSRRGKSATASTSTARTRSWMAHRQRGRAYRASRSDSASSSSMRRRNVGRGQTNSFDAEAALAPHGAGLTNLLFLRPRRRGRTGPHSREPSRGPAPVEGEKRRSQLKARKRKRATATS